MEESAALSGRSCSLICPRRYFYSPVEIEGASQLLRNPEIGAIASNVRGRDDLLLMLAARGLYGLFRADERQIFCLDFVTAWPDIRLVERLTALQQEYSFHRFRVGFLGVGDSLQRHFHNCFQT